MVRSLYHQSVREIVWALDSAWANTQGRVGEANTYHDDADTDISGPPPNDKYSHRLDWRGRGVSPRRGGFDTQKSRGRVGDDDPTNSKRGTGIQESSYGQSEHRFTETKEPQVQGRRAGLWVRSVQVTGLIGSHVVTPARSACPLIERGVCG